MLDRTLYTPKLFHNCDIAALHVACSWLLTQWVVLETTAHYICDVMYMYIHVCVLFMCS